MDNDTRQQRAVLDVSRMPTQLFGSGAENWWGTVGFMVIEGTTLALCVATHFYLRRNFDVWPPFRVPLPAIGAATVNLILFLASILLMSMACKAAKRMDIGGVKRWLLIAVIAELIIVALRVVEISDLNVRWDANAYGSAVWAVMVAHTSLLAMDFVESVGIMLLIFFGPIEEKHLVDVSDNGLYWYFIALAWVPLYFMIFLLPRI